MRYYTTSLALMERGVIRDFGAASPPLSHCAPLHEGYKPYSFAAVSYKICRCSAAGKSAIASRTMRTSVA